MGNDGGSYAYRAELVKVKKPREKTEKSNAEWTTCTLSKTVLCPPVVVDKLGKLYNKSALIEFLLDPQAFGDASELCGYITSLKDVRDLKLAANAAVEGSPFVCPLSGKEMNGTLPFVALASGTVYAAASLNQLSEDPETGEQFDRSQLIKLNPPKEEQDAILDILLKEKASKPKKSSKRKRDTSEKQVQDGSAAIQAARRAINSDPAKKTKLPVSAAVASLYEPVGGKKKQDSWLTMGTFTRYA